MSSPDVVLSATDTFRCHACAGHCAWHAVRQTVVCVSCGTALELAPARMDPVERFDLVPLLRDRADSGREWQPVATSVRCAACHAVTHLRAGIAATACEACGAASLVVIDQAGAPISPTGVVPFCLSEAQALDAIGTWIADHARWDFGRPHAASDAIRTVYLPCWDYFAHAHCPWRMEVTRKDRDGTMERVVRSGEVEQDFEVTQPAVTSVPLDLLAAIEPFDLGAALPFDSRYLAGATVEHYTVNMWDAWDAASAQMRTRLDKAVRDDARTWVSMPDETWPSWSQESARLLLVPVFVCEYRARGRVWPVLVNGATGKVAGEWPWSVGARALSAAILVGAAAAVGALLWGAWTVLKAIGFRPLW